jgi:hypothetical protein
MFKITATGLSRRLYTGMAVLAVLAGIICAYYYYVSQKERKLQARNFRVLHRIEANFERRIEDHRQAVLSKLRICATCRDKGQAGWRDSVRATIDTGNLFLFEGDSIGQPRNSTVIGNGNDSRIYFYISGSEFLKREGANQDIYLKVSTEADKILEGVLRYDVFPSYILAGSGGIAYNNCREICEIGKRDTLPLNDNLSELKIGTGKFFVFNHPFALRDQQVMLSGIIPEEAYGEQKHSIPTGFLLTVFLVLLIILLAFPFIKSFLVSPEETFDVSDVLSALLSLFLLCYMFVFIWLNAFTVHRDVDRRDRMLQVTTTGIKDSFRAELYSMRRQLEHYDTVFDTHYKDGRMAGVPAGDLLRPRYYQGFYRAFWLDSAGIQITELKLNAPQFTRLADLSERDFHDRPYFKAVANNAVWYPDSPDDKKIYLEPVYSRIDGSFRAVMTKKSVRKPVVAALATEMGSVINGILPQEVDFYLVNRNGDILFTSAGSEHINENLLEECNYDKQLSSALYSRVSTFLDVSFLGNDYSCYVSPVEGLPLYVATFRNDTLYGGTQLNICIYTSLLILITLIVFSLAILSMMSLAKKNEIKLIREPAIDLSILLPARKHFYRDLGGIINNIGLMIAVAGAAYLCRDEPFTLTFLFLINAAGTTAAFCYARLALEKQQRTMFWGVMTFLLFGCDVILYQLGGWENKPAYISFILYELLLMLVVWRLGRVKDFERKEVGGEADPEDKRKWSDTRWKKVVFSKGEIVYRQFAFMLVTWFMLIALVPTIFIYRYFYINEREYRLKSAQVDLARKWFEKGRYDIEGKKRTDGPSVAYLEPYHQTRFETGGRAACTGISGGQQATFNCLLDNFRAAFKPRNVFQNAVDTGNGDATVRFCKADSQLTLTYVNLTNQPPSRGGNTLLVQSTLPDFRVPMMRRVPFLVSAAYLIIVLLFLITFYSVIKFFLKRFFLFEIYSKIGHKSDDQLVDYIVKHLKAEGKPNLEPLRLIILGVTSSGKMSIINEAYEKAGVKGKIFIGDFAEMEKLRELPAKYAKGDVLILKHFEHNLGDAASIKAKLNLISGIFQMEEEHKPHLIISSNMHPSIFLNSLKSSHLKAKTENEAKAESFRAEDYIEMEQYYNWTGLLSGFTIHVKRYRKKQEEHLDLPDNRIYDASKSKYIFYLSIWNSLERIEKFVLYDLALDNLVNYRNKAVLYNLYNKGLVILEDDVLQLMNKEFRAFILNEISEEDVALVKRQSGSRSAWNMFRIPFFMILIGSLLFVFVTQQETFNKLMAAVAAFAGAIPILIKLMSFNQEKKPA